MLFCRCCSSGVKTVADRYRDVAYHNKHWSHAYLVLSTPSKGVFKKIFNFWLQRTLQE